MRVCTLYCVYVILCAALAISGGACVVATNGLLAIASQLWTETSSVVT